MFSFVLFLIYLVVVSLLLTNNQKWWVKVDTQVPICTYYFGPFDSVQEAESYHGDYIQDLREEGAQGISYVIEKACPRKLTISADESAI